jgi:hypothetical protein
MGRPFKDSLADKRVENIIVVNSNEIYWGNEDGSRGIRICGAVKSDGRRCLAAAGLGTDHLGIGYCVAHDKFRGAKNWLKLTTDMAKKTSFGQMLENCIDQEVKIGEVQDEIRFGQAFILYYVSEVLRRGDDFTKDDIKFLKELNLDMIRSKESAARIKGSMKLDALTVKQFVDQLLPFLLNRLVKLIGREEAFTLVQDMNEEVFVPMTAQSLISGDMEPFKQIPNSIVNAELGGVKT